MSSLKIDVDKLQYFLICECGYKTNIDYFKNVDIDFSKEKYFLKNDFLCEKCNRIYNKNFELQPTENIKKDTRQDIFVALIFSAVLISLFVIFVIFNNKSDEPTFYDTGDPRDMTNKEFQEFLEWKEKKKREEWENQKIFE